MDASGKAISPSEESFSAAAKGADWSKTFAQDLTFQKGDNAWPISSTTFILVYKQQQDATKGAEVLKFFDWAYKNGDKLTTGLDYASLPQSVISQIQTAWKTNVKDSSGKSLY